MFFSKAEYIDVLMPFVLHEDPDDDYACILSIEAYGTVLGEMKYCYASYSITPEIYDELKPLLKNSIGKSVYVTFKVKKEKVKSFKIDLESLAIAYNDQRFADMELLCWGLNDRSFKELNANNL